MSIVILLAAQWISGIGTMPATTEGFFADRPNDILEKRFTLDGNVRGAVWRVAAPGMRDLFVNGRRVTPTALPPWTPYAKRILEERFDVGAYLKPHGENTLRIELGDGWYNPLPLSYWYKTVIRDHLCVGLPCVRATLEVDLADGGRREIATDATWRAAEGRIVRNSIYLGVTEDLRRKPAFASPARVVAGPPGRICPAEDFPKTVVYRRWKARSARLTPDGDWVVDFGVNFAGTVRARLTGLPAGRRVRFRSGERIYEDGSVNVMTAVAGQIKNPDRGPLFAVAEECDEVIADGRAEIVFEPRLAYHVFRYVQVEGLASAPQAEDFEALAWSADVRETSAFTCSNARLNALHDVCRRTFRANMQSVQSDCPGREKFGYGGDIAATAEAFWCNYDMRAFYRKTVRDFTDEASDDGVLTETAPFVGIASSGVFRGKDGKSRRSGPMGWSVGLPVLLDTLVRYAGDLEILAEAYPTLTRYVARVHERYPDHDIPRCLGDWIPPDQRLKADTKLSALAHWHQFLSLTAKFARILGKGDDAARYGAMADEVARKFRQDFVRPDGLVGRGRQGDQLFALYHGLLDARDVPAAEARLKEDIVRRGSSHMTGLFATGYLLEYLSARGSAELVGRVVTHEGEPGWFHMLDCGATTLWEEWNEDRCRDVYSNCHPMFGCVDGWMVRHLLGIAVCADAVGCNRVMIEPKPVAGVTSASGWFDTPRGRISVAWKLVDGKLVVEKSIPDGIEIVEKSKMR